MKHGRQRPYDTSWYERMRGPAIQDSRAEMWSLALAIRRARKTAYLTQQELADKIRVTRAVLAQWETARKNVPMPSIRALQDTLPDAAAWIIVEVYSPHHGHVGRLVTKDYLSRRRSKRRNPDPDRVYGPA